jgi:Mlc titration factor MtfA (ptsG expression regulator)
MLAWMRRRRVARRSRELLPDAADFETFCRSKPELAALDSNQRECLRQRTAEILACKAFHGAGGLEPDWSHCLPVAAHAALPLLGLGPEWYRGFRSFILYEDAFEVEIEELDDDGLEHRGRDLRAGEAWELGPIVLSLTDVADSGRGGGYDVVIHELAHQLDQLNGEANGCPPLHRGIRQQTWTGVMKAAFQRLRRQIDIGAEPSIDAYGAESPAEFFAVASEYLFDAPDHLQALEPEVYELLARFYGQRPGTPRARRFRV